jgi:nitric oxide reductase NorE protein
MTAEPHARPNQATQWEPPGGVLVWIIVVLELITFAAGFIVFAVQGRHETEAFRAGRALLNQPIALANTLVLLTGGWCMANGIACLEDRQRAQHHTSRWIGAAIFTGIAFLLLKSGEYAQKIQHGIGFGADTFFTLYWLLTGFHFLHVLAAVVLLAYMWSGVRAGRYHHGHYEDVASAGIFWHLCDLIWLLLYPIIYLLR